MREAGRKQLRARRRRQHGESPRPSSSIISRAMSGAVLLTDPAGGNRHELERRLVRSRGRHGSSRSRRCSDERTGNGLSCRRVRHRQRFQYVAVDVRVPVFAGREFHEMRRQRGAVIRVRREVTGDHDAAWHRRDEDSNESRRQSSGRMRTGRSTGPRTPAVCVIKCVERDRLRIRIWNLHGLSDTN